MAGEVRIGGTDASIKLQGNDTIKSDQAFSFPDAAGELLVADGKADIETTGSIKAVGKITTNGNLLIDASTANAQLGIRIDGGSDVIVLKGDGSINAKSKLLIGPNTEKNDQKEGIALKSSANSSITVYGDGGTAKCFQAWNGNAQKAVYYVKANGDYYFAGTGTFRNAILQLEPDEPNN